MKKARMPRGLCPRIVYQPDYDHEVWLEQGAAPTPKTHPDAYYIERVYPAYPRKSKTRKEPKRDLSRKAMRKRLYQAGLRGAELVKVLAEVRTGAAQLPIEQRYGGSQALGWPVEQLKIRFGKRIARALLRHVRQVLVFMDEFGCYAAPGFGQWLNGLFRESRKHNLEPEMLKQDMGQALGQVPLANSLGIGDELSVPA